MQHCDGSSIQVRIMIALIGGTHPAASGGAWMTAVLGFAGMRTENGNIAFVPRLPKNIRSVTFCSVAERTKYIVDDRGVKITNYEI